MSAAAHELKSAMHACVQQVVGKWATRQVGSYEEKTSGDFHVRYNAIQFLIKGPLTCEGDATAAVAPLKLQLFATVGQTTVWMLPYDLMTMQKQQQQQKQGALVATRPAPATTAPCRELKTMSDGEVAPRMS